MSSTLVQVGMLHKDSFQFFFSLFLFSGFLRVFGWFSACVLVFKPVVSCCCGRGVYDILKASTSKQAKP